MKPEEQNIAIAEALGWKRRVHGKWSRNGDFFTVINEPKNYVGDANTRPEMLAALSRSEIRILIKQYIGEIFMDNVRKDGVRDFLMENYEALLHVTQPQFSELWLKVKGLWREKRPTNE